MNTPRRCQTCCLLIEGPNIRCEYPGCPTPPAESEPSPHDLRGEYWPKCAIEGCEARACLRLKSIYCHPHTVADKPASAGREWWAVLEEQDEDGYSSGAICSEGGGNLYWHDNQFKVIEKSAYDALKAENDELRKFLCEYIDNSVAETEKLRAELAEVDAIVNDLDWGNAYKVDRIKHFLKMERK